MNEKIFIKNLTKKNIFQILKPLCFIGFLIFCWFKFGFWDSRIMRNLLIFLYLCGVILTIVFLNYFSGVTIIDENGLKKKSLFFSHTVKWQDIKSVNVQLITANRFKKILKKEEYFDEFYIGKKEILLSDLHDQLDQPVTARWKKIIRLPFDKNIINLLKHYNKL